MNNHELNYLSEELIKHNYNLRLASVVISDTTVTHWDHHTGEYFEFTLSDQLLAETLFLFFAEHMDDMLSIGVNTIDVKYDPPEFMHDENQWEPGHYFIGMKLLDNSLRSFCHDDLRLPWTIHPALPEADSDLPF